jgi:hypothetical protein
VQPAAVEVGAHRPLDDGSPGSVVRLEALLVEALVLLEVLLEELVEGGALGMPRPVGRDPGRCHVLVQAPSRALAGR